MNKFDAAISFDSNLGPISIWSLNEKIIGLAIGESCEPVGRAKVLRRAQQQVLRYLAGKSRVFELEFELAGTTFQRQVWQQIATIPFGESKSYGEIAQAIGNPTAVRAVGGAVGANPLPIIIGCHRVLGSSGKITGYSGGSGIATKKALLELEKIPAKD